jgi:hypothetical protein
VTSTATSTPGATSATSGEPDFERGSGLRRAVSPSSLVNVNLHDWIDELCDVLEIEAEVDEGLLADLAKLTHDNVEAAAAPVTAFLLGIAAGENAAPDEVERLAARAQALAEGWDRPANAPDPDDIDDEIPDDTGVDHSLDELDELDV